MSHTIHHRPRTFLYAAVALFTSVYSGCRESEQIRSYTAPKEAAPPARTAGPAAAPGEPTDRMLAAILPVDNQAYFFKVVGPIAAIGQREKELTDFFAAIRVGEDGKPKWQPPAGWQEGAGNPMRLATLVVPTDGKPLEVAISALPWSGTPEAMLSNINRWRGQLQLAPIKTAQIGENSREFKAGDKTITVVDLRGRSSGAGMSAPFASGAAGAAGPLSPEATASGLPAGHPPIDSAPAAVAPGEAASADDGGVPKFVAPADWKPQAATGLRRASFAIGGGDKNGLVTLTNFPLSAGPSIADPLQNLNQWRLAVGLGEAKPDELAKFTESMEVAGKPTTYVRVVPDPARPEEAPAKLAVVAAMVKNGDQVWFFKLMGERTLVAAQEEAFKNFLKSVQFAADGGASNGNK